MKKCGVLGCIAGILVIVGGLNWGLVGLFGFNLVDALVGAWPMLERTVYILVGLSAVYSIFAWCKCCKSECNKSE